MARGRRRGAPEPPGPAGFLVVDKPAGWTSHDAVDAARGWLRTRRVGHLGTLDPRATGVLPLAVREATKLVPFVPGEKSYAGTIRLGEETDSFDAEGRVVRRHEGPLPDRDAVARALEAYEGWVEQVPPMFSAVKRGGVPLHRLARRGQEVERPPKRVRIDRIGLVSYEPPDVRIEVDCQAGTYVRVLAAELGRRLGCGAYLLALDRTRSGPFTKEHALRPAEIQAAAERGEADALVRPAARGLGLPEVTLSAEQVRRVAHGGEALPGGDGSAPPPGSRVAAVDAAGALVAVMEVLPGRRLKSLRVLRSVAPPR